MIKFSLSAMRKTEKVITYCRVVGWSMAKAQARR